MTDIELIVNNIGGKVLSLTQFDAGLAVLLLTIGATLMLLLLAVATLRYRSHLRNSQQRQQHTAAELNASQSRLAVGDAEKQHLQASNESLSGQIQYLQSENNQLNTRYAELDARTRAEQKALDEKIQLLQQNRQQLTGEFENLANRIFDEKAQKFSTSSQQMLDGTLSPLKTQLNDFRKKVEEVYSHESKERHLLKEQITQLREESLRISEDANNLTRALKHDNKTQGNWGELSLARALEMCGLREPEEYQTQVAMKAEDGSRQIPDVVVHLPGGKDVIIDSKVSLLAYARYFEAGDDADGDSEALRAAALKDHIASVRNHIKELSEKSYDSLVGVNTLDYVMLYIPIEGASTLALQSDKSIWGDAYSKNIVLVSPTNLLAILRSVETIWRHERQNKNAEKIAVEAGRLHDHFVLFAQSLEDIGKHLQKAQKSYETSFERLNSGRGNLLKRVANLKTLGAKTKKDLPAHLTDNDEGTLEQLAVDSASEGEDVAGKAELDTETTES